jgi:hypothetical protein
MTGAVIVVIKRRMADAKSRKVPKWWKMPVFAIVKIVGGLLEVVW